MLQGKGFVVQQKRILDEGYDFKKEFRALELAETNRRIKQFLLKSWDEDSLLEANKAFTFVEIKAAFGNSRLGSEAENISQGKWDNYILLEVEKATNIDEAERVFLQSRSRSTPEQIAWEKLESLRKAAGEE